MATIVIKVDGVDITSDVVFGATNFRCVSDGQAGTAVVVIDDRDQTYTTSDLRMGMTLELLIDGTRYWDGWVFVVRHGWPLPVDDSTDPASVARTWTLEGMDRNLLFQKRVLFRQSDPADDSGLPVWDADTTDKVALDDIIANYVDLTGDGLTYDIEEVGSPGPFEEFTLGYVGAPLGVAFDDAAKITGGVFAIGPGRVLRYHDDINVTAPFVLSDQPTGAKVGYREFDIVSDFTNGGATQAFVWGAGRGSAEPVFANYEENPADVDGTWQWGELFVGASKQQTVNRRARTYIQGSPNHRRGHADPMPIITCTIFEPGLRAGDVVTFENELYDYSRALPLRAMMITFPAPTTARFALELSLRVDTPFGVPDLWDYHRKRIRIPAIPDPPDFPIDPIPVGGNLLIDHYDEVVGPIIETFSELLPTIAATHTLTLPTIAGGPQVGDIAIAFVSTHPGIEPPDPGQFVTVDGFTELGGGTDPYAETLIFARAVDGTEGWTAAGPNTMESSHPEQESLGYASALIRGVVVPSPLTSAALDLFTGGSGDAMLISRDADASWFTGNGAVDGDTAIVFVFAARGGPVAHGQLTETIHLDISGVPTNHVVDTRWTVREANLIGSTSVAPAFLLASMTELVPDAVTDGDGNDPGHIVEAFLSTEPTSDYTTATIGFKALPGSHPVTPGPEITGAPWPGGNPYTFDPDPTIENSFVYSDSLWYSLTSNRYKVVSPDQGQWEDQETPERPWDSTPFDLQVSFIHESGSSASSGGYIDIGMAFVDLDPGAISAWMSEVEIIVTWDEASEDDSSAIYAYTAYGGGTGITESLTPDGLPFGFVYGGPLGSNTDWQYKYDGWDYEIRRIIAGGIAPDILYHLRIQFGAEVLDPVSNLKTLRVKIWADGDEEPAGWLIDTVMTMYRAGQDFYLGHSNVEGWLVTDGYSEDYFDIILYAGPNDARVGVDATRVYGGSGAVASGGVGRFIAEVPTQDLRNGETTLFLTAYPYVSGTLVVYIDGTRLREGVDFVEIDPAAGSFRLLEGAGSIYVTYERAGTVPTPGSETTYRPAIQLQYGWGTEFDSWNALFACSAMALDRHTQGANTRYAGTPRSTPPEHRDQQSQVGYGNLLGISEAWGNGWEETLHDPGIISWQNFVAKIEEGRGAIIQGMYDALPANKRFANISRLHALYINERLSNGDFWGYDPLQSFGIIYSASELQDFTEALGFVSAGDVSAAFTQVTT